MSYRYGGRLGVNLENEQRRLQREPVAVWKKEWVAPAGAQAQADVKVLKYVRTADVIRFDEEDQPIEDVTAVMEVDASAVQTPPVSAAAALNDDLLRPTTTDSTDDITPPVHASNDDETMADMSVAAATAVLEAAEEAEPAAASTSVHDKPAASISLGSGMSLDGGAAARDTPPVTSTTHEKEEELTGAVVPPEPVEAASLPALEVPSLATPTTVVEDQSDVKIAAEPSTDAIA